MTIIEKTKIEKNVPIPPIARSKKYPILEMEIGDSFYAEGKSARSSAYCVGARTGRRYVSRPERDGYRIWRVE